MEGVPENFGIGSSRCITLEQNPPVYMSSNATFYGFQARTFALVVRRRWRAVSPVERSKQIFPFTINYVWQRHLDAGKILHPQKNEARILD